MSDTDEMKMTGLILAQSALVGVAVGVFSAGLWLPTGSDADSTINGMTYAMGALAVQTIAYYIFKMFFEQNMKERVQMAEMQRQRSESFRSQQMGFDQRRMDLELRVQEMQLENELRMLQADPSRISSGFNGANMSGTGVDYHNTFNPGIPLHNAENESPLNLGANSLDKMADDLIKGDIPRKKDGSPDLRYKAKRGDN